MGDAWRAPRTQHTGSRVRHFHQVDQGMNTTLWVFCINLVAYRLCLREAVKHFLHRPRFADLEVDDSPFFAQIKRNWHGTPRLNADHRSITYQMCPPLPTVFVYPAG